MRTKMLTVCISSMMIFSGSPGYAIENPLIDSIDCSDVPDNLYPKQFPSCVSFVDQGRFRFPLPYLESSTSSIISVIPAIDPSEYVIQSITPAKCSNPKVMPTDNFLDISKSYIFFDTGEAGMCRMRLTEKKTLNVIRIEAPIFTTLLQFPRAYYSLEGTPRNIGKVTLGTKVRIAPPYFWKYSGSDSFKFSDIVPLYLVNQTPGNCTRVGSSEFIATSPGVCEISIGWPSFGISSTFFPASQNNFVLFTSLSPREKAALDDAARAAADERKRIAETASAQAKENAKLCSPILQAKLRKTYETVNKFNTSYTSVYSKLKRVDYLVSQAGKNENIQIPESEFSEILRAYTAINGIRVVPLYVYRAVLEGTLKGIKNNYTMALNAATIQYNQATPGCKKVVGAPK